MKSTGLGNKGWIAICTILFFSCHPSRYNKDQKNADYSYSYSNQKKVICSNGAVVSAHQLASNAGVVILRQGGNAVDAAIATQFVLAVVYPKAGNLGGGGFTIARLKNGKLIAVDYREKAPAKASRDMFLENDGTANTDKSQYGHLASGVPGTVAGIFETMKYASLPISKLIQPAIDIAENGFIITQQEAQSFNGIYQSLKKYNTVDPVFFKKDWKKGDTLIQKDLAMTLKRIRDRGEKGFYTGETARLIVEEMKRGGGIISLSDLKNYKAKPRDAYHFLYKGYQVVTMPMPSSGGVLLHQMMKMIESRNISALGFQTAEAVQLMTEAGRRAFADRGEYMGDQDYYKVPVRQITSDQYLAEKMKTYNPAKATPGNDIKPGNGNKIESEETTHLSVIDKEGNAVSITTTLNNSYGNCVVVGGAGFFLNDEMDDFSIKPGVPNMYGAIGGDANSIVPGKRMLSSMTPTIVLKDGKPYIVAGTPGGTTIPSQMFQILVNILDFNLSTEDAVYKPKFHHQWIPDSLYVERGFDADILQRLTGMGYHIKPRGSMGRAEVIKILADGKLEAVADIRGEDGAAGY